MRYGARAIAEHDRQASVRESDSAELAARILELRGPDWYEYELCRVGHGSYVERNLRAVLFEFADQIDFVGARVLDFGCGAGASTIVLGRLLPEASFVGVDLHEDALEVARLRVAHHGVEAEFLRSPGPLELPELPGPDFDHVVLNAVWEHMLPDERPLLLGRLLDVLRPDGLLFVSETPPRWWPVEAHTTGLPLLNYLPRPLAHWAARRSPRLSGEETWEELLRGGFRGGSVRELRKLAAGRAALVPPKHGSYGRAWFANVPHKPPVWVKKLVAYSGVNPSVSLALRKLP
jgi:2-polyprenyl-3-methyl-5-hydroxy-6-metoxy-1,4-benzoquinol methylase